jgi:hypothetical protein
MSSERARDNGQGRRRAYSSRNAERLAEPVRRKGAWIDSPRVLDRVIVVDEGHMRRILRGYLDYIAVDAIPISMLLRINVAGGDHGRSLPGLAGSYVPASKKVGPESCPFHKFGRFDSRAVGRGYRRSQGNPELQWRRTPKFGKDMRRLRDLTAGPGGFKQRVDGSGGVGHRLSEWPSPFLTPAARRFAS